MTAIPPSGQSLPQQCNPKVFVEAYAKQAWENKLLFFTPYAENSEWALSNRKLVKQICRQLKEHHIRLADETLQKVLKVVKSHKLGRQLLPSIIDQNMEKSLRTLIEQDFFKTINARRSLRGMDIELVGNSATVNKLLSYAKTNRKIEIVDWVYQYFPARLQEFLDNEIQHEKMTFHDWLSFKRPAMLKQWLDSTSASFILITQSLPPFSPLLEPKDRINLPFFRWLDKQSPLYLESFFLKKHSKEPILRLFALDGLGEELFSLYKKYPELFHKLFEELDFQQQESVSQALSVYTICHKKSSSSDILDLLASLEQPKISEQEITKIPKKIEEAKKEFAIALQSLHSQRSVHSSQESSNADAFTSQIDRAATMLEQISPRERPFPLLYGIRHYQLTYGITDQKIEKEWIIALLLHPKCTQKVIQTIDAAQTKGFCCGLVDFAITFGLTEILDILLEKFPTYLEKEKKWLKPERAVAFNQLRSVIWIDGNYPAIMAKAYTHKSENILHVALKQHNVPFLQWLYSKQPDLFRTCLSNNSKGRNSLTIVTSNGDPDGIYTCLKWIFDRTELQETLQPLMHELAVWTESISRGGFEALQLLCNHFPKIYEDLEENILKHFYVSFISGSCPPCPQTKEFFLKQLCSRSNALKQDLRVAYRAWLLIGHQNRLGNPKTTEQMFLHILAEPQLNFQSLNSIINICSYFLCLSEEKQRQAIDLVVNKKIAMQLHFSLVLRTIEKYFDSTAPLRNQLHEKLENGLHFILADENKEYLDDTLLEKLLQKKEMVLYLNNTRSDVFEKFIETHRNNLSEERRLQLLPYFTPQEICESIQKLGSARKEELLSAEICVPQLYEGRATVGQAIALCHQKWTQHVKWDEMRTQGPSGILTGYISTLFGSVPLPALAVASADKLFQNAVLAVLRGLGPAQQRVIIPQIEPEIFSKALFKYYGCTNLETLSQTAPLLRMATESQKCHFIKALDFHLLIPERVKNWKKSCAIWERDISKLQEDEDLQLQLEITYYQFNQCIKHLESFITKIKGSSPTLEIAVRAKIGLLLKKLKIALQGVNAILQKVESSKKLPDEFICPLSKEVMTEPVTAEDKHDYEKSYIERWLKENLISPCNRQKIGKTLTPNNVLKAKIEAWKKKKSGNSKQKS